MRNGPHNAGLTSAGDTRRAAHSESSVAPAARTAACWGPGPGAWGLHHEARDTPWPVRKKLLSASLIGL